MKKKWQVVMAIAVLGMVFGNVSGAFAQEEVIAGGYGETSNNDPEVVTAARYAIRAEGRRQGARISLLSIERADVQVVAGLNYMLRLKVKVNNRTENITAVVYKNLKQKYSLSSWDRAGNHADNDAALSNSTIEQLVKSLAEAYEAKELGKLDIGRPYFGKVRIVIEHSLAEDNAKDRFEIKSFKTLAMGEQWLKSREMHDVPARATKPLQRCRKGLCTYDFGGGINHNNLYLKKITYGYRNGRPYVKTIFLLDGD